ncbi:sodium:proton antiporter [Bacteroidia bacterium]|nr:sodium:proton antiporter [Bacteroidia bacterium]GHV70984.1 sodium:proton antiporter [Bacteroidia bacterium]
MQFFEYIMSELSPLISELALILVVAGFASLLFKWLKQPVVLAYIVAGIVISFFITKEDPNYENIETWAEIGIIFLLFGLGLEFSFKKLMKVGATAFVATLFIVVSMISLGYLTGICLGWSQMTSLFLGAMICMSSTMIIIKVFSDFNMTSKSFAGIVLGILIIEDLVAVLLMVLLSTIAVSKNVEGMDMLYSLFKLVAFLLFWFILGTYLLPTFLRKMKRFLNDETLLLFSVALCFGMVFLATEAGFSSALGAFIMGSILAETIDSERIEKLILPIKDLFGAIFFVSVGMLVQISSLGEYLVPILIISSVVIIGQIIFATGGVILSGQNLKTAVFSGFSMTQIGEFSYIIGALGLSLGVIENSLYQIIVSVSVVTIFTTPFVMKLAGPAYNQLEKRLPVTWINFLNKDSSGARPVNQYSLWSKLLKEMSTVVLIYYFICIIIINFALEYGTPFVQTWLPGIKGNLVFAAVLIFSLSPFIRAIIIKKDHSAEFVQLWKNSKANRGPLVFTIIFRVLMCAGLIMYVLFYLFHTNFVIAFTLALILLMIFSASRHLKMRSIVIERRFKENFHEKEKFTESRAHVTKGFVNHVLAKDLHLSDFAILPYYSIVGKTLKELNFRQFFGVNIVTIIRGDIRINIPNGNERIYPNDHIVVLGTDKQMDIFQKRLEEKRQKYANKEEDIHSEVRMRQIQIEPESHLAGKTIRTSGIHETFGCLLVGIERNKTSMQNPDLDLVLEEGDVLWLIGEYDNIIKIKDL